MLICCVIALLFCITGNAKVPYIPKIINYSVSDYKAGNQNWAVSQGPGGKMYIGNNRGLLVFDGIHWDLVKLPNNLGVRALYISKDGRIYVGSFEEFGYFEMDDENDLIYHSLSSSEMNVYLNNDEFWTINEYKGEIYFQSFRSFFIYDGEKVRKGVSDLSPLYIFTLDDHLYVQFMEGGSFCRMDDGQFTELLSKKVLEDDVVSVLPFDHQLLLVSARSGCFIYDEVRKKLSVWNTPANEILKEGIANRGVMMKDSTFIVGTISNGVVAINKQGETLWHINRENGLINNTVLRVFADNSDNLWVTLDNGIAQIHVNSPIYFYEPLEAQIGMVHDMVIEKGIVYLATNQGLYALSENDSYPTLIPGTQEQTWYISDVGNQLIAGHNTGTLQLEGRKATQIPGPNGGGTALRKTIIHGKEVLLQMSYRPLSVFTRDMVTNRWKFSHNVEGFSNLIKSFEVDPTGNIWASHMYKGIYRLRLNEDLRSVKEMEYIGKLEEGNESGTINVMKLRGRIVFSDGSKFYTYEDLTGKIVPYDLLNEDFPELSDTYRVVSLNNDLYWFIRNSEYVLLGYESGRFQLKQRIPFTLFDNPTIEDRGNIYVASDGTSYFCLNGGIARYDRYRNYVDTTRVPLSLSQVRAYNRHENEFAPLPCKGADAPEAGTSVLSYSYNTILFKFSYPDFTGRRFLIYYKLDGFDNEWIEGTSNFQRTYSNLPYGNFVLHAVVKDDRGKELSSLSYPFKIERPFYSSWWALIIYFALFLCILVVLVRMYTMWIVMREKKANEEQKRLQEEQLRAQEQLIVKLENEKLENDLTYKSKELASATLSVISHNDFLEGLKKEIQAQQLSGSYTKRFFDKLIRMIEENISGEDEWAIFQTNFDRIHEKFFTNLKERYPDLTPGDLRLCALLRLNMPTKDMARMQNLSVRGIEAARYRLRKKLNLPEGQSLVDFMIQFH